MSILLIELTQKYLRLMEGTFGFGKFKLTQSGVFYLPEQLRKEEEARLIEELKKYDSDYLRDDMPEHGTLKEEVPSQAEGDLKEADSDEEEAQKEDEEENEGKR